MWYRLYIQYNVFAQQQSLVYSRMVECSTVEKWVLQQNGRGFYGRRVSSTVEQQRVLQQKGWFYCRTLCTIQRPNSTDLLQLLQNPVESDVFAEGNGIVSAYSMQRGSVTKQDAEEECKGGVEVHLLCIQGVKAGYMHQFQ